ncbi:hypothetical protein [Anaerolactibacter massiliensis]|jgi:multiple sugar transport system permease protein|nr:MULTISPECIES: hypothetical protein [Erysipelotrichaceae]MDD5882446.1 hypothetical protein [Stecheria intestinalis]
MYGTLPKMEKDGIIVPLLILFAFTQKWFINSIGGETGFKG